jgi:hypothetical protein
MSAILFDAQELPERSAVEGEPAWKGQPRLRRPVQPSACKVSLWQQLTVGLALLSTACNSQYATRMSLTRQMTEATKETADLLATVKDKQSAEAAAPNLKPLVERIQSLGDRFEAMDTEDEIYVGRQDQRVLEESGKMFAEHARLMQEQYRIGQIPEARKALGEAWARLTGGAFDPGGLMAPGGEMDLGRGLNAGGVHRQQ